MKTAVLPENQDKSTGESKKTTKRKWWVAGILSCLCSGLGQVYCGRLKRGIILFIIPVMLTFVLVYSILPAIRLPRFFFLITLPHFFIIAICVELFIIIDAIIIANKYKDSYQTKPYNKWYVYLIVIVIVQLGVVPMLKSFRNDVIQAYIMPAESMAPTILRGDFIFIDMTAYSPKSPTRGDVIVFYSPEHRKKFAKRVIGMPGDTVEIRKKEVFINGKQMDEPYKIHSDDRILHGSFVPRDTYGPIIIPVEQIFVLGDNRDKSLDSRIFGPIELNQVEGKVARIYFSWDSVNWRIRCNRIGQTVQ